MSRLLNPHSAEDQSLRPVLLTTRPWHATKLPSTKVIGKTKSCPWKLQMVGITMVRSCSCSVHFHTCYGLLKVKHYKPVPKRILFYFIDNVYGKQFIWWSKYYQIVGAIEGKQHRTPFKKYCSYLFTFRLEPDMPLSDEVYPSKSKRILPSVKIQRCLLLQKVSTSFKMWV